MGKKKKIDTEVLGSSLVNNPFAQLDASGLSLSEPKSIVVPEKSEEVSKNPRRGRVDVRREMKGRGGKTVTTVKGIPGLLEEKTYWLKKLQSACASGGALKDGIIEIQGDQRDRIAKILQDAGFRVVFSGG